MHNYQDFMEQRRQVAAQFELLADRLDALGLVGRARSLRQNRRTLERDAFRLMVVGEFKRGKSTPINALLGADVLPMKVAPCTAVITELRWGEEPAARLHFRDTSQPPQDVPVASLRSHLVIGDDDEALPPYRKVEVFWPLPLLQQNVELVDSPGLNEHQIRNDLAMEYLPRADALLVVLSCEQALSASELAFIDGLGKELHHVFFLWNRYDALTTPEDRAELDARSARVLAPRLAATPRIFPLSSREALLARKRGEAGENSGIPAFAQALERFLSGERGRVKLTGPLHAGIISLHEVLRVDLPEREAMLAQPLAELQARYLEAQPRLDSLRAQREALLHAVDRRQRVLVRDVQAAWAEELERLVARLPAVTQEVDPGLWTTIRSGRVAQQQVAAHLATWLEGEVQHWQEEKVVPMLRQHMVSLEAELNHQLGDFLRALEALREALTPGLHLPEGEELTPLSRVLGAVSGLLVGGLGGALEGAGYGFSHMLRAAGYHLALTLGLLVAGAGAPVILGASLVLGLSRSLYTGTQVVEQIRMRVAQEVETGLRQDVPRLNQALEQQIAQPFVELKTSLDEEMRRMVEEVEQNIQQILAEKAQGEVALAAERRRLDAERLRLQEIQADLIKLRDQIA